MKRLSARLSERLEHLDRKVSPPVVKRLDRQIIISEKSVPKLRLCPGCNNYKTTTPPLWVFGSKVCRYCQRMNK